MSARADVLARPSFAHFSLLGPMTFEALGPVELKRRQRRVAR